MCCLLLVILYSAECVLSRLVPFAEGAAGFNAQENLQEWMLDTRGRDQFVIRYRDQTEIYWNDAARSQVRIRKTQAALAGVTHERSTMGACDIATAGVACRAAFFSLIPLAIAGLCESMLPRRPARELIITVAPPLLPPACRWHMQFYHKHVHTQRECILRLG